MSLSLANELEQVIRNIFLKIHGRLVNNELFDELAINLNDEIPQIYKKHGYKFTETIDRDFVIYMFNLLVEEGGIVFHPASKNESEEDETPYNHLNDFKTTTNAHHSNLLDDANVYDPLVYEISSNNTTTKDSEEKYDPIKTLMELFHEFVNNRQFKEAEAINSAINALQDFSDKQDEPSKNNSDASYLAGYNKAKEEEFPIQERSDDDYVYVEFYNIGRDEYAPRTYDIIEATFKFNTLNAAKEFVKLNGTSGHIKSMYVRYYELKSTTTLKKTEIK